MGPAPEGTAGTRHTGFTRLRSGPRGHSPLTWPRTPLSLPELFVTMVEIGTQIPREHASSSLTPTGRLIFTFCFLSVFAVETPEILTWLVPCHPKFNPRCKGTWKPVTLPDRVCEPGRGFHLGPGHGQHMLVCECVRLCARVCVHMHVCTCVTVWIYARVHTCLCACVCPCVHGTVSVPVCMNAQ